MSNPHNAAQWRIPVLLALIAAAFLIFSGVAIALYEEGIYRAQQAKDFTEQASILAANETAAVIFGDQKSAQEYVDAMKVNPELQAVAIYNKAGQLMAQTSRIGPLPYTLNHVSDLSKLGLLAISVPIAQDNVKIGTVYLWATEETQQRRIARYLGIALLVVMGALVLVILSFSQRALARANAELEVRAENLALLNHYLVRGARPQGAGKWSGSLVVKGNSYAGTMTMVSRNFMRLDACSGFICRTYEFTRL